MFVIAEKTTGRKYCGNLHRQIWKIIPSTGFSFFADGDNLSHALYIISFFQSAEEANDKLNAIKHDRIVKLPFEMSEEAFDRFGIMTPLLDESEIKNPELEVQEIQTQYVAAEQ